MPKKTEVKNTWQTELWKLKPYNQKHCNEIKCSNTLTSLAINIQVVWDVMLCQEEQPLFLDGFMEKIVAACSSNVSETSSPHGVTSKKILIFINTAVRSSNLVSLDTSYLHSHLWHSVTSTSKKISQSWRSFWCSEQTICLYGHNVQHRTCNCTCQPVTDCHNLSPQTVCNHTAKAPCLLFPSVSDGRFAFLWRTSEVYKT